jgi:hypothetical protein
MCTKATMHMQSFSGRTRGCVHADTVTLEDVYMSDSLNVILIQIDSLNRHFLPVYGNNWVHAPNLTAFAHQATIFQHHYVGSLPCMSARREIWTGTEQLWWRGWGPLERWD